MPVSLSSLILVLVVLVLVVVVLVRVVFVVALERVGRHAVNAHHLLVRVLSTDEKWHERRASLDGTAACVLY